MLHSRGLNDPPWNRVLRLPPAVPPHSAIVRTATATERGPSRCPANENAGTAVQRQACVRSRWVDLLATGPSGTQVHIALRILEASLQLGRPDLFRRRRRRPIPSPPGKSPPRAREC